MKWILLSGILLLFQPPAAEESLTIHLPGYTVTVNREDFSPYGISFVDTVKFDGLLDTLEKRLNKDPVNAVLDKGGRIVPEAMGQKLDRITLTEQFYAYFYGTGASVVDAPLKYIYPEVDSEVLAQISQKQIGRYVTYFNARNKNRSHNIRLAAEAINNHVIFPGKTFSFNKTVGKRTKEKGYLEAPIIVRGELAEGIGGGICQVSSTLFNAVDSAGLHVTERYSHSRNVPYVRPRRDATVSWQGPDFSFRNQYNQPVLIRASAGTGSIQIVLYSSDVMLHKPREVPGVSKKLPDEIPLQEAVKHNRNNVKGD